MARTLLGVFSGCLAFLVAGGGILFLGWVLWWLWSQQQQEEPETTVEIEIDAAAADAEIDVTPGFEEEALPPPEEKALLSEPEEAELLPAPGDADMEEPGVPAPKPVPVTDIEGTGTHDDLRAIEGIGPRIAGVLRAGGVHTFADLAAADVAHIEGILRAEDPRLLRLCKPDTWPEQAALAAAGDWEGLQALTAQLKRGRRA